MKRDLRTGMILLGIILFNSTLTAQTDQWETATSKDGKVTAKFNFSTRIIDNDNEVPVVESVTTTIEDISIDKCISLMKNISKHKDFRGEKESRLIETVSENEWIIYYYKDGNLLLPAVDGAYVMIFDEDKQNRKATFTITAEPALIEEKGASRITYSKEIYSFTEIENDQLEITITASTSPGFKVPVRIMKRAFPKRLFDNMEKFLDIVNVSFSINCIINYASLPREPDN